MFVFSREGSGVGVLIAGGGICRSIGKNRKLEIQGKKYRGNVGEKGLKIDGNEGQSWL